MVVKKIAASLLSLCWGALWMIPVTAAPETNSAITTDSTQNSITKYDNLLFPVIKNDKYGYINTSGKLVIPAQFDGAFVFREGLGRVKIGKKYGFINLQGKIVIAPQFDRAAEFTDGLALIGRGNTLGYVNRSGQVTIEDSSFTDATPFSNGRAVVRVGKLYGFINPAGQRIIPIQYTYAHPFQAGLAMVLHNGKWDFIDINGNIKFHADDLALHFASATKRAVYPFGKDGFARIWIDGKTGYINSSGKPVIKPQFTEAYNFNEGLAPVKIGDRYGYIDTKGKLVIPAEYSTVSEFQSGLAAVQIGNKFGYIDRSNQLVIAARFDKAFSFNENLAAIVDNKRLGYIDRTGKLVWQAQ